MESNSASQVTLAHLWEKRNVAGQLYLTGHSGPTRYIIAPIAQPRDGRPSYRLIVEQDTNWAPRSGGTHNG